jgi:predicted protein tyrosine phosphatase
MSSSPSLTESARAGGAGIVGEVCVCSLAELPLHAGSLKPSRLISLVPSFEQPATPSHVLPGGHLRLELDDIETPLAGHILPEIEHVERLVSFVRAWNGERPLLIHCAVGVSRSTAAALVALSCLSDKDERQLAAELRKAAPHASPNRRIVGLADTLLHRRGRLLDAVDAMGPPLLVAKAPLVRLPVRLSLLDAVDSDRAAR